MKKREEIVLIGGGGHCKSCIDVIELENKFQIAGIVDLPEKLGHNLLGYPYFAVDDDLTSLSKKYRNFLITIGQIRITEMRIRQFKLLIELGVSIPAIISPLAYVSKYSKIGKGTIIMHRAIVVAGSIIGNNCIINTNAHIEHDAVIGDHCHVATGAIVNGGVQIGKGSFIGSGAVTRQYSILPEYSFVKANSLFK